MYISQRVQVLNIEGLWSQKPLRVWFWGPENLNIGYLDPLKTKGGPCTDPSLNYEFLMLLSGSASLTCCKARLLRIGLEIRRARGQ